MLLGDEADPDARVPLLSRLGEEDHVAVERDVEPLEQQHRHETGGDVVLIVDGAAPVDVAAVPRGGERRMRPLRRVHGDDVGVPHDQERALAAGSLEAGDDVGATGVEREDLRGDALTVEHGLEVIGGAALVAGRVARVDPE